jgi:hypothetical protein
VRGKTMKLYDLDGNFVTIAKNCKKPKFAGNGRSWDIKLKIVDGIETDWHYDSTWGRNMYFEFNGKWYYSPVIRTNFSDGVSQYKEYLFTKENPNDRT